MAGQKTLDEMFIHRKRVAARPCTYSLDLHAESISEYSINFKRRIPSMNKANPSAAIFSGESTEIIRAKAF